MASLEATVVVPTTGDRWPTLRHALATVRSQTVDSLEIFVIGDGVAPASREAILELEKREPRLRFFDHPKHPRRGEPNRHAALAQARGRIVCYLCDRDLMAPWHVETMTGLLRDADFANSLIFDIRPDGEPGIRKAVDLARSADRRRFLSRWTAELGVPLSFGAHTLDMYRRLPHGWRTTPEGVYTDNHMWRQFLSHAECRAQSGRRPSILYFPKFLRREWPVEEKAAELARWRRAIACPGGVERLLEQVLGAVEHDRLRRATELRAELAARSLYRRTSNALAAGVRGLRQRWR